MVKKYIIVLLARPLLYIIYLFFYLTYFSANSPANRNVIVWGSPGTGKTIMAIEAAKIKFSKLITKTRMLSMLVTTDHPTKEKLLLQQMKNYLSNSSLDPSYIDLDLVCQIYKIFNENECISQDPVNKINGVTSTISRIYSNRIVILLVDEMRSK